MRVTPLVAEIVTFVEVTTDFVVIVKVALVFPAGTVTLAGTVATAVELLERVTTVPAAGAGPEIVTVPVDGVSPLTVVGFKVRDVIAGAVTVNVAVWFVPRLPVIVTEVFAATGLVVTVKVAVVAFAGTVTLAGTFAAAVLLLDSVTTAPPDGAGPVNVRVPVDEDPPIIEVGLKLTALRVAAVTVKLAVLVTPKIAVIVTEVLLATGLVVMVNVAVVAPAATVTLDGTCVAVVLLLDSVTTAPFEEAGPVNVTVPVDEDPPITEVGLKLTPLRVSAVTVKLAVLVTPKIAVIVTEVLLATGLVMMVNVAVVAPAATVTLAGTCAAAVLLLDSVTTAPPAGAGPVNLTVPVDEIPPTTEVGLTVRPLPLPLSVGAVTVKPDVLVTPYVPAIVAVVLLATGLVVMVNVAVVAPAATVTLAGTCAAVGLLLDRLTTAPPAGAAAVNVTVPVDEVPPTTEVGFTVTVLSDPVRTARLAVCVWP